MLDGFLDSPAMLAAMRISIVSAARFLWARIADASTIQWLLPGVGTVLTAAVAVASGVPVYFWLPLSAIAGLLFLMLWHFGVVMTERLIRSPIEISFDVRNPRKKFWTRQLVADLSGFPGSYVDEYRVLVRNTSSKTLRNVCVSRESVGLMPTLAEDMAFQKDGARLRDIDPGREELVNVFWQHPPRAGDAWGQTASAFHGPIVITVSAEDVPPATFSFVYEPDNLPALVPCTLIQF